MLEYVLAGFVGILLGGAVNLLADHLPCYRSQGGRGEQVEEAAEAAESVESGHRRLLPRHFVVIALLAGIAIYVWQRWEAPFMIAAQLFYLALFVLVAVIDLEHRLVLSIVMLPAFALALVEIAITRRVALADALVGYAVAQIAVMIFYLGGSVYLWAINAHRDEPVREVAFGFGDVTLATFCGMVLGYPAVVHMLILMVLLGGVIGLIYLLVRGVIHRRYEAHMAIPYGPAIVIAAAMMLLWGDRIAYWVMGGR